MILISIALQAIYNNYADSRSEYLLALLNYIS